MLISGVKHACAKCIRGHRSSSCAHSDRPLFEIRKKGRPVSQCPHCRDLRKIKSSHTKCECGANPGEGTGKGKCQCHSGQPCICAGQPQVFQYIAPDLSGQSTHTAPSSTDGARTPTEVGTPAAASSMLHTFNLGVQVPSASRSVSPKPGLQGTMPPPVALPPRRSVGSIAGLQSPGLDVSSPRESFFEVDSVQANPGPIQVQLQPSSAALQSPQRPDRRADLMPQLVPPEYGPGESYTPQRMFTPPVTLPHKRRHIGESSISRSTRSIGTNTDPLPPGVWPEDPWEVPAWMISRPDNVSYDNAAVERGGVDGCCPKVRDMPLKDLPFDANDLAPATSNNNALGDGMQDLTPVPDYTVYYGGAPEASVPPVAGAATAVHHYGTDVAGQSLEVAPSSAEDSEFQFDQAFWDKLMEVPGCSLPGVQCRCGDDCSCSGCQTHRDNGGNVAAAEIARMDVADDGGVRRAPREHPAGCCDTRSLHEHHSALLGDGAAISAASATRTEQDAQTNGCCGGRKH